MLAPTPPDHDDTTGSNPNPNGTDQRFGLLACIAGALAFIALVAVLF